MSTKRKHSAEQFAAEASGYSSISHAPTLERAIDRLFPPDVLANLRDPDRPALERLDDVDDLELKTSLFC